MKSKETWMRLAWSWLNRKGLSSWRTTFVWCWQVLRPFLSRSWVTTEPRVTNVAEFSFWLLSFHSWLLNMWGWPRVVVLFRIYPSPVTVTVFHVLASPLTRLLVSRFGKEEITRAFSFAATDNALVHPCVPGLTGGGGSEGILWRWAVFLDTWLTLIFILTGNQIAKPLGMAGRGLSRLGYPGQEDLP